jgi:predicted metalloendopeptidase
VKKNIAFPAYYVDPEALAAKYAGFAYNSSQYVESVLGLEALKAARDLRVATWRLSANIVSAEYEAQYNSITVPFAILQSPFFNSGHPKAANFGHIGTIVGHELIHGFDPSDRLYDGFGNLLGGGRATNRSSWSNAAIKKYKKMVRCFQAQYYNNARTTNENIADNGGLALAFRAYANWRKSAANDTLPRAVTDVVDSGNKLFFLAFAQNFCSSAAYNKRDAHSLPRTRVTKTLANAAAFSREYGCPVRSQMNPVTRCKIW